MMRFTLLAGFWDKISYMSELFLFSILFMIPARKRPRFPLRFLAGTLALFLFSWTLNTLSGIPEDIGQQFLYWPSFLIVMVPYLWFLKDGTLGEAIYMTACVSASQHISFNLWLICPDFGLPGALRQCVIYLICMVLVYSLASKHLVNEGRYTANRHDVLPISAIVLIVCMISVLQGCQNFGGLPNILYRISDTLCCIFILWGQVRQQELLRLQQELDGIHHVWNQQRVQYQISQETIDTINRKCHDLRYQIRALQSIQTPGAMNGYLKELEDAVQIYDTRIHTGNEALDVVLMEKELFCAGHRIQLTCLADGKSLAFMNPADIYALFGNALDNAIAAVMDLENPEKRVIVVRLTVKEQLIVIQIQNYHDRTLIFQDGLPRTTQADRELHGYGMKSMRYTAEKYDGVLRAQTEDDVFRLSVLLPVKSG